MEKPHVNMVHMEEAAAEAARVARGVPAGGLDGPTPCGGWDTRELINHWVLYTSHGLERRARREQLPEELTGRDFAADPEWAGAYAAQLGRAVAAWADPLVWEGEVDLGVAKVPATDIASMNIAETALHGWDVARATGQEYKCSEALGEFVLGVVEQNAEMYRQYDGFAEPVAPARGAGAFERAVALSGRDPGWRA